MPRCPLLCVLLLLCACSRGGTTPAGTAPSASSPSGASHTPQLCRGIGKNNQEIPLQIDDEFVATHEVCEVLDPVWWTADIYDDVAAYDRCLTPFSREQRLMFALLWYLDEVDNGGHHQFFFNSTGIVFPDALAALQELNVPEGIAILAEARRRMGGTIERDHARRQVDLERLHPDFEDLDSRFYDLDKKVSILDRLMTNYLHAHRAAFSFHGIVPIPASVWQDRKKASR